MKLYMKRSENLSALLMRNNMICKVCNSEFSQENFEICPFCLAPIKTLTDNEKENDEKTHLEENQLLIKVESNDGFISATNESSKVQVYERIPEEQISESQDNSKFDEIGCIVINSINGLSTRTINVLGRNEIKNVKELLAFLEGHKVSELKGAGKCIEEEVADIISKIICGDFTKNNDKVYLNSNQTKTLEERVVDAISCGEQQNINIDVIFDLSNRTYNVLKRNEIDDVLTSAEFLSENGYKNIRGAGVSFKQEMTTLFEKFLEGNYSNVVSETLDSSIKDNLTLLFEERLIDEVGSREYEIFLRRARGETLQEIADNPQNPSSVRVTRERVRQIEGKLFRKYKKLLIGVVHEVWGNKKYIPAFEVRDLYKNDELGIVIFAMLKKTGLYEYLDFADCFVNNLKYPFDNVEKEIVSIVTDFVGKGINLYDYIEEMDELFLSKGIDFMDLGALLNFFDKYGFKMYGDYVTQGKASYAALCKNIIIENFPNGIKLSQDNDNSCEDLKLLRELAKQKYGDISIPESDRALSARLSDYLVLCDRGRAIPEEKIQIDFSTLNRIKEYIDKYEVEKIYYSELYANFEGLLRMTSNVDNYYFLHGILVLFFPNDYEYRKDYLIRKNSNGPVENISERIRKYIHEMNRPISKSELTNRFPGFTKHTFDFQIDEDPVLMHWGYNLYYSVDLFSYSEYEKDMLTKIINNLLNQNQGFTTENLLFDIVEKELKDFLKKNNIKTPMQLFCFCSKILKNQYAFKHPNIGRIGLIEYPSIKEVALYLMGYPTKFSYTKYLEIASNMNWTPVSVSNAFSKVEEGFCRISEDEYISKEMFAFSDEIIKKIKLILLQHIEQENYISLINFFDFSDFPEVEYEWNTFLLEKIVTYFIPELIIINPVNKDRRFQRAIIIKRELGINSYSELVAYIFKNKNYTSLSEGKFLSFLVVNGLAYKIIPKEIGNSDYFKIEKDYYILNND